MAYTKDDLVAKVEWEGGILDALGYGIKHTDIDESEAELRAAWDRMAHSYRTHLEPALRDVERLLGCD